MDPEFATRQFLTALEQIPGWQDMPLTDAAQAVQVSAFPDAYAQHEWRATQVVDAILGCPGPARPTVDAWQAADSGYQGVAGPGYT